MTALYTLDDIKALKETWQIECKLAQGRDGYGALPEDIWETYSAFANTQGGDIFLGLRELGPGDYELAGIPNPHKVQREFFEGVNDTRVVSANVLCIDSVAILQIDGLYFIHINVPRAPVYLRPVYIGTDVLSGSYVRSGSADLRLDPERVRRMQARVRGELLKKS
jgi:predicted HTH transcriptional regulator